MTRLIKALNKLLGLLSDFGQVLLKNLFCFCEKCSKIFFARVSPSAQWCPTLSLLVKWAIIQSGLIFNILPMKGSKKFWRSAWTRLNGLKIHFSNYSNLIICVPNKISWPKVRVSFAFLRKTNFVLKFLHSQNWVRSESDLSQNWVRFESELSQKDILI